MSEKQPTSHVEWEARKDARLLAQVAERDQLAAQHAKQHAALIEAHERQRAADAEEFAAWRASRETELAAFRDAKVTPLIASFGRGDTLKQAIAICEAVRAWNGRTREQLGCDVHPAFLIDGLSGGNDVIGDPQFVSCEPAGRSCDRASKLLARILAGAGPREVMRDLIDAGVVVERDMAAIAPSRISEQTKARAKAMRSVASFHGVLRAVAAADREFDQDRDAQAFADPGIQARARIAR